MAFNVDDEFGIQMREWELHENSTIYDNLRAAPADAHLNIQWIAYIAILSIEVIFMFLIFFAILLNKKCRRNAFNQYVLFAMPPDLLFNFSCVVSCSLNISRGEYFSEASCKYQAFYIVFAFASSSWLNAAVTYQLYTLLTCSQQAKRYHAPTTKRVAMQSVAVYIWSAFVASWTSWDQWWWPIQPGLYHGAFCLPMVYDTASLLFFFVVLVPCIFLIPFSYVCYAVFDIWRKGILPPKEKRKTFMVFVRLVLIYFVLWMPAVALIVIGGMWLPSWFSFTGAMLGHLQGAVTPTVYLFKPDVSKACKDLLCCCFDMGNEGDAMDRSSFHVSISRWSTSFLANVESESETSSTAPNDCSEPTDSGNGEDGGEEKESEDCIV